MDNEFAKRLCALNTSFYESQAESFSDTRNAPWHGWQRCAKIMADSFASSNVGSLRHPGVSGDVAVGFFASSNADSAVESSTELADPCIASSTVSTDSAFEPVVVSAGCPSISSTVSADFRCSVLDVACGNLRFEKFIQQQFPNCDFAFHAVDNCVPLVESGCVGFPLEFEQCDVVSQIIDANESGIGQLFGKNAYDFVCSFGFMHHIPGFDNRLTFIRQIVESTKSNGLVFLSFWRFMSNEKLAKKAIESTNRGAKELGFAQFGEDGFDAVGKSCGQKMDACDHQRQLGFRFEQKSCGQKKDACDHGETNSGADVNGCGLEKNDYLLGWKDVSGAYRYCHHFDEDEMQLIVDSIVDCAEVVDRFTADGRSDDLNEYLVLRAR